MIEEIIDPLLTSEAALEGIVDTNALDDNALLCLLTQQVVKATEKELNLQVLIRMLSEEYGFDLDQMERDFAIAGETDAGKKWKRKAELVVFAQAEEHTTENAIRLCGCRTTKPKRTTLRRAFRRYWRN